MEGKENKQGYDKFLDKQVAVFYPDAENHISRKDGKLVSVGEDCIVLVSFNTQLLIPKHKILRMEIKNGN